MDRIPIHPKFPKSLHPKIARHPIHPRHFRNNSNNLRNFAMSRENPIKAAIKRTQQFFTKTRFFNLAKFPNPRKKDYKS